MGASNPIKPKLNFPNFILYAKLLTSFLKEKINIF